MSRITNTECRNSIFLHLERPHVKASRFTTLKMDLLVLSIPQNCAGKHRQQWRYNTREQKKPAKPEP
ncbi:hypothetical protein LINPERPRIM_LOCUS35442 [Linum perenne]